MSQPIDTPRQNQSSKNGKFYTVGPGFSSVNISEEELNRKKIFVGNLPKYCTSMELFNLFRRYGEILEAVAIPNDSKTQCRGYGFVTFKHNTDTYFVLNQNDPILYDDVELFINTAKPTRNKRFLNGMNSMDIDGNEYNMQETIRNTEYDYESLKSSRHEIESSMFSQSDYSTISEIISKNSILSPNTTASPTSTSSTISYSNSNLTPISISNSNSNSSTNLNPIKLQIQIPTPTSRRSSYGFNETTHFHFNNKKIQHSKFIKSDPFFEIIKDNKKTQNLMKKQKQRFMNQYLTRDILQIDVRFTKPFPLKEMLSHF